MSPYEYLSRIVAQPLALDKARGRTFVRALAARLMRNERPSEDVYGDPLPSMQVVGDTAYIPVVGVLDIDVPDWLKSYGFNVTDVNDVCDEIDEALADLNVRQIVFPSNSPGGSGLAAEKLFDWIETATKKKPTMGYVKDGQSACSGMYWALAACDAIYAGWYAEAIGNVGAYITLLDDSEYWKQNGFDWIVLRDGFAKGIGVDKPSEEQLAYLQGIASDCAALFRENVKRKRAGIADEEMQGQWFKGSDAAKHGFVSANAPDLNAALAKFRRFNA
jgi:ClpP class serine protease